MAKKKQEILCTTCQFFIEGKCEHPSNYKILLKKRIEKKVYKSTDVKKNCQNYVQQQA